MMCIAKAVIQKRILFTQAYVWKYVSNPNTNIETWIPLELNNSITYVRTLCKMSALRVTDQPSSSAKRTVKSSALKLLIINHPYLV